MASEKDVEDETIFKLNRSNFALEIEPVATSILTILNSHHKKNIHMV